jgi:hypothetical protein
MPLRSLEFEARLAWSRQTNIQEILEVFLHVLRWGEGLETNLLIGSTFFKSSTYDLEFWGERTKPCDKPIFIFSLGPVAIAEIPVQNGHLFCFFLQDLG